MVNKHKLYLISFVEGASVMAAEICGAKLLAPFFGSSLYVWSSVMAITLGGLASGYFIGGKLSKKEHKVSVLQYILIAAVTCLCLMPLLTHVFIFIASHLSLIPAVISSVFILLFPTTLCMGATSPLIISILTQTANDSGENSGRIYAISTLGGIIATFLCGFYLIPTIGITMTLLCFSLALAIVSLLLINLKKNNYLLMLLPFGIAMYGFTNAPVSKQTIYETEGILGKLEVRDEPSYTDASVTIRKLLINNIVQTEMDVVTKQSVSQYIQLMEKNLSHFPKGKALVLGLGGGIVANKLMNHHYSVTAVEFDARIIDMARQFFYLNDSVNAINDDARHYINQCSEMYQLILFDIFKAEEQPSHVITIESLNKLKQLMDTNSVVLINTHGYIEGTKGLGTQCLLATLKKAGFCTKVCTFSEDERYRNLLIVAFLKPLNTTLTNELTPIDITYPEIVNTDNKPILEILNAPANQAWRSSYLRNYILSKD